MRLGDWEGDTISGAHKGGLLKLVERKCLLTKMAHLPRANAKATHKAKVTPKKLRRSSSYSTRDPAKSSDSERQKRSSTSSPKLKTICARELNPRFIFLPMVHLTAPLRVGPLLGSRTVGARLPSQQTDAAVDALVAPNRCDRAASTCCPKLPDRLAAIYGHRCLRG